MSSPPPEAGASQRIVGLYEDNAAAWDRMRGRDLSEKPWLDRFRACLPPGGTLLDLGCGMGEPIARYFIENGFQVTRCDTSSSLIEMCRNRFLSHEWIVGDMRTLDLQQCFDGVIVWHSSFHLTPDDQRSLVPRLAAHTRSGGYLMFTSGHDEGVRIGEWQGEPLYHASLAPEEYRALLEANKFAVVESRLRDPECGDATVWLAQMRPASGLDGSA